MPYIFTKHQVVVNLETKIQTKNHEKSNLQIVNYSVFIYKNYC